MFDVSNFSQKLGQNIGISDKYMGSWGFGQNSNRSNSISDLLEFYVFRSFY